MPSLRFFFIYRILIQTKIEELKGKAVVKELLPRRERNEIFQGILFI